jgi:hypothetical protein
MYNFNTELGTDMIYMQIANQQINMVMKKMYCWECILKYTDGVFFLRCWDKCDYFNINILDIFLYIFA